MLAERLQPRPFRRSTARGLRHPSSERPALLRRPSLPRSRHGRRLVDRLGLGRNSNPRQPFEPAGEVPVPVAEQLHARGKQDPPDDRRVDQAAGGLASTLPGAHGGSQPSQDAMADIPADYLILYQAAAATCPGLDWTVLA